MEILLTKDAQQELAVLYKLYKSRLKDGISKSEAAEFTDPEFRDKLENIPELRRAGLVKENILGDITLKDEAIAYLESKPANSLKELLSFAAQFIP